MPEETAATTEDQTSTGTDSDRNDLMAELEALREQRAQLENQLKPFKGIDPKQLKEWKKKAENYQEPPDVDALRKQIEEEIREQFGGTLEEERATKAQLEKELRTLRVDSAVMEKAATYIKPDGMKLLKPLVDKHVQYDSGELVVLDETGNRRYSKSNPKLKMTVEEYLQEVASEFPSIAADGSKTGTGSKGKGTGGSFESITPEKYKAMSKEERRQLPADVRGKLAMAAIGMKTRTRSAVFGTK